MELLNQMDGFDQNVNVKVGSWPFLYAYHVERHAANTSSCSSCPGLFGKTISAGRMHVGFS
jgi:hypothetical protein